MDSNQSLVKVKIFGRDYTICSEGDREHHVEKLAFYVNKKMKEITEATSETNFGDVAALACLNIADEFEKARKENRKNFEIISSKINDLISKIEEKTSAN
jgi:cell division protein ZapA